MKRKRSKRDHQTRERVTSSFFFSLPSPPLFFQIAIRLKTMKRHKNNWTTVKTEINWNWNLDFKLLVGFMVISNLTRIQIKSNFFSKSFFAKMCIHERQDSKKNLSWESRSPTRSYAKQSSSTMTIGKERNWIGLFISFILMVTGLSACIIQTKYQLRFFPSVLLLLAYVWYALRLTFLMRRIVSLYENF